MITVKNKSIVFFLGLCPIVPVCVHLAEGLILITEFWLLIAAGIAGTFLRQAFTKIKLPYFIEYFCLIFTAVFYNEVMQILFPVYMITLKIYGYLLIFSYVLLISLKKYYESDYSLTLPIWYTAIVLIISALREFLIFGTISFPGPTGLISFKILPIASSLTFWGSNAGVLILLGIGLWIFRNFQQETMFPH